MSEKKMIATRDGFGKEIVELGKEEKTGKNDKGAKNEKK